jgi:hypothetical protein
MSELQTLMQVEFEGLAPTGNAKRLMTISPDGLMEHLVNTGSRSKIEEAWLIPDICQTPTAIWRDWDRAGTEGYFCYSGVPLGAFATEHQKTLQIPKEKVFLVYLTDQFEAVKWCYCQADPNRPGFPIDHEIRFGERLWPQD